MNSILTLILIIIFGTQMVTIFYLIGELLEARTRQNTILAHLQDLKETVKIEIANYYARKENEA